MIEYLFSSVTDGQNANPTGVAKGHRGARSVKKKGEEKKSKGLVYSTTHNTPLIMTFNVQTIS